MERPSKNRENGEVLLTTRALLAFYDVAQRIVTGDPWMAAAALPIMTTSSRCRASRRAMTMSMGSAFMLHNMHVPPEGGKAVGPRCAAQAHERYGVMPPARPFSMSFQNATAS